MTNAQAAAYFASQPPDAEAKLFEINGDTSLMRELSIDGLITAEDLEEVDDPDEDAIGHPYFYDKW